MTIIIFTDHNIYHYNIRLIFNIISTVNIHFKYILQKQGITQEFLKTLNTTLLLGLFNKSREGGLNKIISHTFYHLQR